MTPSARPVVNFISLTTRDCSLSLSAFFAAWTIGLAFSSTAAAILLIFGSGTHFFSTYSTMPSISLASRVPSLTLSSQLWSCSKISKSPPSPSDAVLSWSLNFRTSLASSEEASSPSSLDSLSRKSFAILGVQISYLARLCTFYHNKCIAKTIRVIPFCKSRLVIE